MRDGQRQAGPLGALALDPLEQLHRRPQGTGDVVGVVARAGGRVTQTVRATASTPPLASSSAEPAGRLRPAAGPARQATRQ